MKHATHWRLGLALGALWMPTAAYASGSPDAASTGATAGAAIEYRFVVLADSRGEAPGSGPNGAALGAIFDAISRESPMPRFAFFGGDLVFGYTSSGALRAELDQWRQVIESSGFPVDRVYPVFGGHERVPYSGSAALAWSGFRGYFDPVAQSRRSGGERQMECRYYDRKLNPAGDGADFSHTVYFCDYGEDRFFVLNNDCVPPAHSATGDRADGDGCVGHEIGCGQFNWVRRHLEGNGKRHNFFFVHEPAYGTGAHHAAGYDDPGCPPTLAHVMDNKRAHRNDFVRLLGYNNATALFSGHEHQYVWRRIDARLLGKPLNDPDRVRSSLALLLKAAPLRQAAGPAVAYSYDGAVAAGSLKSAPILKLWWTSATGKPDWAGRIRARADDAEELLRRGKEVTVASTDLDLMRDEGRADQSYVALRWRNVPIPAGATIHRAELRFRSKGHSAKGPWVEIRGEAAPFAFPFSQCRKDLSLRPQTRASVRWKIGAWKRNKRYSTPDLSPIIQELLDVRGFGERMPGEFPEVKTGSAGATWYGACCSQFMGNVGGELIRLGDYTGQGEPFHYAVVDVSGDDVDITVKAWDGTRLPSP